MNVRVSRAALRDDLDPMVGRVFIQPERDTVKINFNNVRKQAVFAYGRLVKELNFATNERGEIELHADQIREHLSDLRGMLGAIAYTYIPDDPEFKDLADEIGEMPIFNPEPEEVQNVR